MNDDINDDADLFSSSNRCVEATRSCSHHGHAALDKNVLSSTKRLKASASKDNQEEMPSQ